MTELLIALLAIVLIGAVVYAVLQLRRRRPASPSPAEAAAVTGQTNVTLPVDDADPSDPAVRRLVAEAATRALAADPALAMVVVVSRTGRELGRVDRPASEEPLPFVDVPLALRQREPQHRDPHLPVQPSETLPGRTAGVEEREASRRSLADHFELSEGVRARLRNPEDPVDLVRAIVEQSGARVDVDGDLFRRDDKAIIVLHTPLHVHVGSEGLNAAFLRFQQSGARHGVMVTAGGMSAHDVRRREALAPQLLHAGPEAIQRMADAAAMGADPLDFVVPNW